MGKLDLIVTTPSEEDQREFESCGLGGLVDDKIKLVFTDENGDTAIMFIDRPTFDKLGEDYIVKNTSLCYSSITQGMMAVLSQNAYYNDTERYPEKTIPLKYVATRSSDGAGIYKSLSKPARHYLRLVSSREKFAKWLGCRGYPGVDAGDELRSNLIFEFNGQTEKIRYDDWNGVAAYNDTFNPNFGCQKAGKGE